MSEPTLPLTEQQSREVAQVLHEVLLKVTAEEQPFVLVLLENQTIQFISNAPSTQHIANVLRSALRNIDGDRVLPLQQVWQ